MSKEEKINSTTASIYLKASMTSYRVPDGEKVGFYISDCQSYPEEDIVISEISVTMEMPDNLDMLAVNGKFVDALREQQEKIKAEAHIKVENIEGTIQNLLALPVPE